MRKAEVKNFSYMHIHRHTCIHTVDFAVVLITCKSRDIQPSGIHYSSHFIHNNVPKLHCIICHPDD